MEIGYIYSLTFPNGKRYIGQTTQTIEKRFKQHIESAFSTNGYLSPLKSAIRYYGINNIKLELIDIASTYEELDKAEIYWIKFYNTCIKFPDCQGYNILEGGQGEKRTYGRFYKRQENIKTILKMYKEGKSTSEIGKAINKSSKYVRSIVNGKIWGWYTKIKFIPYSESKVHGLATITKEEVDKILEYSQEFSPFYISEILGLSYKLVYEVLNGKSWGNYTNIQYSKKGKQNILTEDEIDKILSIASEGKTYRQISEIIDRDTTTIWEVVNGITHQDYTGIEKYVNPNPGKKITKEEINRIMLLNSQGYTCLEISQDINRDIRMVWAIVNGLSHRKETGLQKSDRKHNDRLTHEELDLILKLHKEGKDAYYIAEKLNKIVPIIQRVLYGGAYSSYTGIEYQHPREQKKQKDYAIIDKILELNKTGKYTQVQIAKMLNITSSKVNKILTGKNYSSYTGIKYVEKR